MSAGSQILLIGLFSALLFAFFLFQPIMDIVKVEPESDDETQPVDSENEVEPTNVRRDGLGTFTFVSVKEESVSVVLLHVIQI
jgi:hypothetical protein